MPCTASEVYVNMNKITMVATILSLCCFGAIAFADRPIVIAHRGASGYLPEHTLAAYRLAIEMGADYIEPDLVITKDGEFIVRHEHYLSQTTDVAARPKFKHRKRIIDDREDWFSEDFTLSEIATLRARQAFKGRSKEHDGQYPIPTFQEVIDLVKTESERVARPIGIYPEIKRPGLFKSLGFDVAGMLVAILDKNGLNKTGAKVFIQSFEPEILRSLKDRVNVPLVQLVTGIRENGSFRSNISLNELSEYADGVGAIKWVLVNLQGRPGDFVVRARKLDLFVHAWTFREDKYPEELFRSSEDELKFFLKMGIDGFFTDFPDVGVRIRDEFSNDRLN